MCLAWLATDVAVAQDSRATAAQAAARDWLVLTDRGDAQASWDAAGKKFRAALAQSPVGPSSCQESARPVRPGHGAARSSRRLSRGHFPGHRRGRLRDASTITTKFSRKPARPRDRLHWNTKPTACGGSWAISSAEPWTQPAKRSHSRNTACPACGAEALWNPAKQALVCPFCGTVSPAKLDADTGKIVEHDLVAALRGIGDDARGWQVEKRYVKCQSCQAISVLDPARQAQRCEFCGSAQLVPYEQSKASFRPESLLPFKYRRTRRATAFAPGTASSGSRPTH